MEACGGAHHWGRQLRELGHQVKLLSAKKVRPFVSGNKNDAQDARAIWSAAQQPDLKEVALKSEAHQAVLALHRMRRQLMKFRNAQMNCLRGLLAEYGEVMPKGYAGIGREIAAALERVAPRLPAVGVETLGEQWARVGRLHAELTEIESRLQTWPRDEQASQRLAQIPGVGLLSATAAVAMMGDLKAFKSGREFAAWLGLVPRHLGISKRGDRYLRPLLIHGARAVLTHSKTPPAWAPRQATPLQCGRGRVGEQDRSYHVGLASP